MGIDVYLGLGSNLDKPVHQIQAALEALDNLAETAIKCCSSLYASQPMGPQDQPDYVNAVVLIHTQLAPLFLLKALQEIELEHGRVRKSERWGPRTLDIDILLYGEQQIDSSELVVPHYGMKQREFVLFPLFEISPQLCLPDGELLAELIKKCPINGLKILSPAPIFQLNN
ncbi:2-amino-4-hydroxy-6-hydroxymethyldihydropteridine diphosphokinase [Paraglaciecola hydrolytica]|uniref:2-amino-4-hydroxy-6-hydroxymethyldihydropteridine pyrophosphokinase n=1 Tax=Paraglaciecola hydrolytica TaxID=1799789 RepID=A0A136A395_9ALTE|nr:2-amino-4-hydroxy-6-hydroxymethyldihydropteridine diphosphokinase [Paraglaciecola hydrolytica]KXI29706.1 2-amino-4-hydroxy-6-hydroxymethyldihydropteridine pyrophosphokinase [Paraglaciecola hydrolytica]